MNRAHALFPIGGGRLVGWRLLLAVVWVSLLGPVSAADAPAAAAPGGQEATVTQGDLHRTLPVVGEFRAHLMVNLAPQVGGRVVEVLADVGDKVDPSKPVVKLDTTLFKLEIAQQEAGLTAAAQRIATLVEGVKTAKLDIAQAQLTVADAQVQFDRMQKLYDKPMGEEPSVSKKMYDDAELRLKQAQAAQASSEQRVTEAQARVQEAQAAQAQIEAALAVARERLAETEIHPKFPAVVTRRLVAPGDMVASAPATTLLELQDLEHLELLFNVPQDHAAEVKQGDTVHYRVPGLPGNFNAVIERILPLGDAASRSYRCRVLVDNPAGQLRPGQLVQVRLTLETRAGVTIAPPGSLRPAAAGWQVLVKEGDKFTARAVQVGLRSEEGAEITAGLKPGEVVQLVRE